MARYKMAISLSCAVFLLMLGVGVTVSLLPRRVIALSGSFADVGCLASAFALPFVLFQVPIGRLADRYGFRAFLIAGYTFCCFSGLIYCFADTPTSVFVGRILQGTGEAPIWALAPALLSIQYSEGKGEAMGMYNASIHLGLTAGSLLGLLTFDVWNGDEAFWVLTGTSMCGGLLMVLFIGSPHRGTSKTARRGEERSIASLMSSRNTWAILAGIALYGCGYGMFLTVVPMSMLGSESSGGISVGVFFVLFYVAVSMSQFVGGRLSDRIGRIKTMVLGLITAAVCIALAPKLQYTWLQIALALASFGLGVFCVSSMVFLSECVPASLRGTISGAFYLSWGGGYFVGPILLGKLTDLEGLNLGMFIFALLLLGEAVAVALMHRKCLTPAEL